MLAGEASVAGLVFAKAVAVAVDAEDDGSVEESVEGVRLSV